MILRARRAILRCLCGLLFPFCSPVVEAGLRLGSPNEAPLLNFQIHRSTPLFVPSAPRPCPLQLQWLGIVQFRRDSCRKATQRGQPKTKELNHGWRIARIKKAFQRKVAKTPRRQDGKSFLQCYFRELCIFDKVFPSLFSQFAPVQILWLRLAAPGLCTLASLR